VVAVEDVGNDIKLKGESFMDILVMLVLVMICMASLVVAMIALVKTNRIERKLYRLLIILGTKEADIIGVGMELGRTINDGGRVICSSTTSRTKEGSKRNEKGK
jgi:hypothetical protein